MPREPDWIAKLNKRWPIASQSVIAYEILINKKYPIFSRDRLFDLTVGGALVGEGFKYK
jgi:hypothetical protein